MPNKPVLYGYSASTYVRTVRIVLADKQIDYDQVQLDVLNGEPHLPEHLARHPFGKVPVLDIDGMRIRETDAICRYLNDTRPGMSSVPDDPKERARMNEAISLYNSYGYPALLGIAGYHLFPDFIGGQDDAALANATQQSEKLLRLLMDNKGAKTFLASDAPNLADYLVAPMLFYIKLTPDADKLWSIEGVSDWWSAIDGVENYKTTEPQLG